MKIDKPSRTAMTICLSQFVLQSHEPFKEMLSPEQVEVSKEVIKKFHPFLYHVLNFFRRFNFFIRLLGRIQARRAVTGLSSYWMIRKRAIQDAVEAVLQREKDVQVVALAAGFDTLTYRLAKKYPHLRFFETDHPATQKAKGLVYDKLNLWAPNNILIPCDYTQTDVETVLQQNLVFDQNKKTIFIAEGLMMYLPHQVYMKMLTSMKSFIKDSSFMIFSYLQNRPDSGRPGFLRQSPKLDPWLEKHREPFMWGRSPMELEAELYKNGFDIIDHHNHETLKKRYLKAHPDLPFAEGENIAIIETLDPSQGA